MQVADRLPRRGTTCLGLDFALALWDEMEDADIAVVPSGLLDAALHWSRRLDCTLYDAAAPALAEALDAQLISADRRAHGEFPGVRIIG
jgi:predicted nucleic acid-binding protein